MPAIILTPAEPLLHQTVSRTSCCPWKVAVLPSLFVGWGLAIVWNVILRAYSRGEQYVTIVETSASMASTSSLHPSFHQSGELSTKDENAKETERILDGDREGSRESAARLAGSSRKRIEPETRNYEWEEGTVSRKSRNSAWKGNMGERHEKQGTEEGIWPLNQILREGNQETQANAAASFQNPSVNNQSQDLIGRQGDIRSLIQIRCDGSHDAQRSAASALANLSLNSQNKEVIQNEGILLMEAALDLMEGDYSDLDKAVTLLRVCVELAQLRVEPRIHLAECYERQSKLILAAEECGRAISIIPVTALSNPRSASGELLRDAKFLNADIHAKLGNFTQSMAESQELLNYSPSDRDAKNTLADILFDWQGDTKRALDLLSSVAIEDPNGPSLGGIGAHSWASLCAGVYAASLAKYDDAQRFFDLMPDSLVEDGEEDDVSESLTAREYDLSELRAYRTIYRMAVYWCLEESMRSTNLQSELMGLQSSQYEWMVSSWELLASTVVSGEPSLFYGHHQLLHLGMNAAALHGGLVLEFGVWHGRSLRTIVSHFRHEDVHGFDTFTGLPEAWEAWGNESVGSYSAQGAIPADMPDNVKLHVGLFKDTLPQFLRGHPGPIRFMHIDCDLYSSTKDIFDHIFPCVVPGTVIVFDEYIMYPTWQHGEFQAFQEAVANHGWEFEYLAVSLFSKQALIRINEAPRK